MINDKRIIEGVIGFKAAPVLPKITKEMCEAWVIAIRKWKPTERDSKAVEQERVTNE